MESRETVIFVGWFKFPFGSAAASRIRTLAKGLWENGFQPWIVTTSGIDYRKEDENGTKTKDYDGIMYETTNKFDIKDEKYPKVKRFGNWVKASFFLWVRVLKLIRSQKPSAIIIYGRSGLTYFPIFMIALIFKVRIYLDSVEWYPPEAFRFGYLDIRYYDQMFGNYMPVLGYDGTISISSFIYNKYKNLKVKSIIIPSVFDFSNRPRLMEDLNRDEVFRVIYTGNCKYGDGFDDLVEAFYWLEEEGFPIILQVLGVSGDSPNALIRNVRKEQNFGKLKNIHFLGRLPDNEYFKILDRGDCLCLPRPDSQTARASFPTRLPEFLSTGNPVLTTKVPDVSNYLRGGIDAELVQSGGYALAKGILNLYNDPKKAEIIGKNGYNRGVELFDYNVHTKRLCNYLGLNVDLEETIFDKIQKNLNGVYKNEN